MDLAPAPAAGLDPDGWPPRPDLGFEASGADFDTVLAGLRAVAESTRLRILAVLAEGELTVSELCRILGQTQPRVSRHLRLLCEAGLLIRHAEGTSAFYAHDRSEPGRSLVDSVLALVVLDDPVLQADRQRLAAIRAERADAAASYFEQIAEKWDTIRSLHVDDTEIEAALLAAALSHPDGPTTSDDRPHGSGAPDGRIGRMIDIGTGTGRMLELFADRIDHGVGIDLSAGMLNMARSNLLARGLHHCSVRQGNIYALGVEPGTFDLAVIHHVLHFLENPAAAVAEAANALAPGGRLVVVDFAPHQQIDLRSHQAHRWLGFTEDQVAGWLGAAGLTGAEIRHLTPPTSGHPTEEKLTVTLWTARQPGLSPPDSADPVSFDPDRPTP